MHHFKSYMGKHSSPIVCKFKNGLYSFKAGFSPFIASASKFHCTQLSALFVPEILDTAVQNCLQVWLPTVVLHFVFHASLAFAEPKHPLHLLLLGYQPFPFCPAWNAHRDLCSKRSTCSLPTTKERNKSCKKIVSLDLNVFKAGLDQPSSAWSPRCFGL